MCPSVQSTSAGRGLGLATTLILATFWMFVTSWVHCQEDEVNDFDYETQDPVVQAAAAFSSECGYGYFRTSNGECSRGWSWSLH